MFDQSCSNNVSDQRKSLEISPGMIGCKKGLKPSTWLSEPYRAILRRVAEWSRKIVTQTS